VKALKITLRLLEWLRKHNIGWIPYERIRCFRLPWWLGLADQDFLTNKSLLLPIPLSTIVYHATNFYIWIRNPRWNETIDRNMLAAFIGFPIGFTLGLYVWRFV